MKDFFEEIIEEIEDFFEDYKEHLLKKESKKTHPTRKIIQNGVLVSVRPAYLFAERIDNVLKIIFAASICISAFTATFLGFVKLSDLLEVLINTLPGRALMFFIGACYFITAFWRLLHLGDKK